MLAAAVQRFADGVQGFRMPLAYVLVRVDGDLVTFGHVNRFGEVRRLPAAVLASVCGYVDHGGSFALTPAQLNEAVARLSPAEAATHMPHPNLWTWRNLLVDALDDSAYVAYFLADTSDVIEGPGAEEFLQRALK